MSAQAMWELRDGTWTLPSFVMRALCQTDTLAAAELYYVLASLDAEERFRDYWDHPDFYQKAGMGDHAAKSIDQRRDGWVALSGDYAWAAGDPDEAMRRYLRSMAEGEPAGIGGQVRLHFVRSQFYECIAAFRCGCPPREFYVEYRDQSRRDQPDPGMENFNRLCARFPGKSFCFVSQGKYMCRAIVMAGLLGGGIDDQLREMICDYFEIDANDVNELAQVLADNDDELVRLQRRITPKQVASGLTFADLLRDGATARARCLAECVPRSASFAAECAASLDGFLKSGAPTDLDDMIRAGSPFGVANADALIIEEALYSRGESIAHMPFRRLELLRRFSSVCQYPKYEFLGDYLEVMSHVEADVEPSDVIAAILGLQWYKTPYAIDNTGPSDSPGGFGKTEISDNREWLEIALRDYPPVFDRAHLVTRDGAIAALFNAYQFMRQRFNAVRSGERWISEAQLGDALSTLFGKGEVQRHARPLWLSPQHLDYFIPRHGLAIEYMGAQHYEPIELFGGSRALEETKARDERKRLLCERMGVVLVYVTHEEDIGRRARQIFKEVRAGGGDACGVQKRVRLTMHCSGRRFALPLSAGVRRMDLMEPSSHERPRAPADLEARITFLTTEAGGRQGPVRSGYRPNHDFGLPGELNDARHEYPDDGWVRPGQSARALLWLLAPDLQSGRLHAGFRFTVQEGRRVVGHGEIVRVINASLERRV